MPKYCKMSKMSRALSQRARFLSQLRKSGSASRVVMLAHVYRNMSSAGLAAARWAQHETSARIGDFSFRARPSLAGFGSDLCREM